MTSIFVLFSCLSLADGDAELDRFLEQWAADFKNTKTLEVRFEQEKRLKVLRRPLKSTGTIRVVDGILHCAVRNARGVVDTVLSVGEKKLRLYYPQLNRLEVYELGGSKAPAMAFPVFGTDPKTLKRDFHARLEKSGETRRLKLRPRNAASPIGSMELVFEGKEIKEVRQIEKGGNSVHMRITSFVRNAKIRRKDLELNVPPGTKIVKENNE